MIEEKSLNDSLVSLKMIKMLSKPADFNLVFIYQVNITK